MKSGDEIRKQITELEADERHKLPPALVDINAPLALIQVEIDAKLIALKWVLDG